MKIITSTNKLNPLHQNFDSQLSSLAGSIVTGLGVLPKVIGDKTCYEIFSNFLNLDTADLLHSKGVEIKNFPLWIEIDNINDSNAFGVLGEDEEPLSWAEWKLSNHTFYEADGKIFIGTNAHTNEDMDFAEVQAVRAKLHTADMLPLNEEE